MKREQAGQLGAALSGAGWMVVPQLLAIFVIPAPLAEGSWDFQQIAIVVFAALIGGVRARLTAHRIATAVGIALTSTLADGLSSLALPAAFHGPEFVGRLVTNILIGFLSAFGAAIIGSELGRHRNDLRPVA